MTRSERMNAQRPALFLSILIVTTLQMPFVFAKAARPKSTATESHDIRAAKTDSFDTFVETVITTTGNTGDAHRITQELYAVKQPISALLKIAPVGSVLRDDLVKMMVTLVSVPRTSIGARRMHLAHEATLMTFTEEVAARTGKTSPRMQEHIHQYLHQIHSFFDPAIATQSASDASLPAARILKWTGISVAALAAAAAAAWAGRAAYLHLRTPNTPDRTRRSSALGRSTTKTSPRKPYSMKRAPAVQRRTQSVAPQGADGSVPQATVSTEVVPTPTSVPSSTSAESKTSTPITEDKPSPCPGDTGWCGRPTPTPIPFSLGSAGSPKDELFGKDKQWSVIEHDGMDATYVAKNWQNLPIARINLAKLNEIFKLKYKSPDGKLKAVFDRTARLQALHNSIFACLLAGKNKQDRVNFFTRYNACDIALLVPEESASEAPRIRAKPRQGQRSRIGFITLAEYMKSLANVWYNDNTKPDIARKSKGRRCTTDGEVEALLDHRNAETGSFLAKLRRALGLEEAPGTKEKFANQEARQKAHQYHQIATMITIPDAPTE